MVVDYGTLFVRRQNFQSGTEGHTCRRIRHAKNEVDELDVLSEKSARFGSSRTDFL
jgi:hypothetical protein